MSESTEASEEAPPAAPATYGLPQGLPQLPQARLAEKITADWMWLSSVYASAQQSTALRDNCQGTRLRVQSAVEAAYEARARMDATVTSLVSPPPAMLTYKESALDFRRKYKAAIVGGIAALSVLPAALAGPGRLTKVRVALRNVFFFGGSATALLYPEFVFNHAVPAITRTAEVARQKTMGMGGRAPKPE